METFASLRENKIIRLNENKDRFIQKNTLLTDEQKQEVLDFFHSHANLEAKVNNGNWNYNIPYEEFKKVINSVDTEKKRLKKQTKELRKQNGLEGLTEGTDYIVFKDTPEYIAYRPLTHRGMRVIASNMVEPKLWCESSVMAWSPKEVLPKGEPMKGDLYPGAKWCVAMETNEHWRYYINRGYELIVVCSKNPETMEIIKKICLVYDRQELSMEHSVTASDTPISSIQDNYVKAVISDIDSTVRTKLTLEKIQKCYDSEKEIYHIPREADITPRALLRLGKLDHPVVWERDFVLGEDLESLVGCPDVVNGSFFCVGGSNLKSLEGAPKKVGGSFYCEGYPNLKSLKGAPEYVGGHFSCSHCHNLKSLEGAPREVGETFYCVDCESLTSLEGAPEYVEGAFMYFKCPNLTSLEGVPKYVGRGVYH